MPEDCTPAIANYLVNLTVSTNSIIATILDLARKGYFEIQQTGEFDKKEDTENIKFILKNKDFTYLLEHEKYFIHWLIDIMGDGDSVTTDDIEYFSDKNSMKFIEHHNKWIKKVKENANEEGYFDDSGKKDAVLLMILFPIMIIISAYSLAKNIYISFFPLFASIVGLFYGIALLFKRSDYGDEQYKKWLDFKKYMEDFKTVKCAQDISEYPLDMALIYALAFEITEIENKIKTSSQYNSYASPNYGWMHLYLLSENAKHNSFEKSINNAFLGRDSDGNIGGGIGGGGGFSGGGGSGAGGGGAGGF